MNAPRARLGGVVRLSIALLATICMLARALLPFPAEAHGGWAPDSELRLLGATLCHFDGGTNDPDRTPATPVSCDHCPLCAAAGHVPLAILTEIAMPRPPVLADVPPPARPFSLASPRAPPEYARNPRAPPAV